MSTDEFKDIWQKYDQKLEQTKILNETIIKQMIVDRSNKKLSFLKGYEMVNLIICSLLTLIILLRINELTNNFKLLILLLICSFIGIIGSIFYYKKLKLLNLVNASTLTLAESYKNLNRYRLYTQREKIYGLPFAILLVFSLVPVALKLFRGIDVFSNLNFWVIRICIALILALLIGWWLYSFIFKKLDKIEKDFNEYEKFEK